MTILLGFLVLLQTTIKEIRFYADGTLFQTVAVNAASVMVDTQWDLTKVPNGSHVLWVEATDMNGNTGRSDSITVTVANPDITPPAVIATCPACVGTTITDKKTQIQATAKEVGVVQTGVVSMQLFLDGALKTTVNNKSSLSYTLPASLKPGTHVIRVTANDYAGNQGWAVLTLTR